MPLAMPPRLDAATAIVVLCSVLVTGAVLHREFATSPPPQATSQAPVAVDDWETLIATGDRIGPRNARVTVLLFSDYECPGCGMFANTTFPAVRAKYPEDVALVYRHWPLAQHKFSYRAAQASECAAAQGRFEAFHDVLNADQQNIGLTPFHEFAERAGIPDLDAFDACSSTSAPNHEIDQDVMAVKALGGTGTPTVVVNGMLLRTGITERVLDSVVAHALQIEG